MDYRDALGELIEVACKDQGISRQALCRRYGFHGPTISLVLAKKRHASAEYVMAVAIALGYRLTIIEKGQPSETLDIGRGRGRPRIKPAYTYPKRKRGRPLGK